MVLRYRSKSYNIHIVGNTLPRSQLERFLPLILLPCDAELNSLGMEEWRRLPMRAKSGDALAEFPGTLYLGDDRNADPAYPSTSVTAEEVANLEPELVSTEAAAGARLYQQEGALSLLRP